MAPNQMQVINDRTEQEQVALDEFDLTSRFEEKAQNFFKTRDYKKGYYFHIEKAFPLDETELERVKESQKWTTSQKFLGIRTDKIKNTRKYFPPKDCHAWKGYKELACLKYCVEQLRDLFPFHVIKPVIIRSSPKALIQDFHSDDAGYYDKINTSEYEIYYFKGLSYLAFLAIEDLTSIWVVTDYDADSNYYKKEEIFIPKGDMVVLPANCIHAGSAFPRECFNEFHFRLLVEIWNEKDYDALATQKRLPSIV